MHGYSATIGGGGQPSFLHSLHLDDIRSDYPNRLSAFQMFPIRGGVYWASSANPCPDACTFAVAASNGTSLIRERQCEWALQKNGKIEKQ